VRIVTQGMSSVYTGLQWYLVTFHMNLCTVYLKLQISKKENVGGNSVKKKSSHKTNASDLLVREFEFSYFIHKGNCSDEK